MSLHAKTVLGLIAGLIAGALAWAATDLTGLFHSVLDARRVVGVGYDGYGLYLLYGATFGLILGLMLGLVEGLSRDSRRRMVESLLTGAGIGFLGGGLGLHSGQIVYGALVGRNGDAVAPGQFFLHLIARAVGWALIGTVVGLAPGLSRRSGVIARQGAFGGLLGGLLGGIVFQIIATVFATIPNIAVLSRLAALAATGGLVGFFVGLVQNLFKQAWVRVMLGKNEGKEYLLSSPITTIGRSELAEIGLFGDAEIAPTHAVIESVPSARRYRLRAQAPTVINGQPIQGEQWLADGDTIQIARRVLQFHERNGQNRPTAASRPAAPAAIPEEALAAVWPPTPSPARTTAGSRLVCTAGPYAGQTFPLGPAPLTIGRGTDRDIALPQDDLLSRHHAQLRFENGQHLLTDAGSSNGTRVNGLSVSAPRPLDPGDLIQMGQTALRYE